MAGAPLMLTAAMIASATGGTVTGGDQSAPIKGFSIDSRSLQPGDLFFAIVAARDGHDFVDAAFAAGAAGVVVECGRTALARGPDSTPGEHDSATPGGHAFSRADRTDAADGTPRLVIEVADTTRALQDVARFVRRQSGATLVAITGSAGKTTTKETIAEFLSSTFRVTRNKGNLNNHLGLPLSLLELRHGADVAVMELGMNHAGEIRVLVNVAEPEVRVWTNVGDAHIGHFASRDAIADAKGEILESARPGDVLVCNADDPLVMMRAANFSGRRITFGFAPNAEVRGESVEDLGLNGTRLVVHTPTGSARVHIPLLGRGNVSNLLAATAVATHLGVALDTIAERAALLRPAAHRGAVVNLSRGVTVVDDSYNSSPAALVRALEVIARESGSARKAAVLGEMLELGAHSLQLHRECGQAAATAQLDRLIAVGGDAAKALAEAAVHGGMNHAAVSWVQTSTDASDEILHWLADGAPSLVLVKGSRGIKTDIVVERITEAYS